MGLQLRWLRRVGVVGLALCAVAWLSGCAATGPKYADIAPNLPGIASGQGRLLVYRMGGLGPAVQPDVRLDGQVIGTSRPEGFFFVDRPAGRYTVSARTEAETRLEVVLLDGATTYIETSITLGLFVGQPRLSLQSEAVAQAALPGLAYTGVVPVVPGPRSPGAAPTAAPSARPGGSGVTLDDLRGLLPPAQR
jgi:hypothetical protein